MFQNRSLRVQVVKDNPNTHSDSTAESAIDFDQINEILKDQVQNAAVSTVVAYAAIKTISTISQIAVKRFA